jgi:hypothetical protein
LKPSAPKSRASGPHLGLVPRVVSDPAAKITDVSKPGRQSMLSLAVIGEHEYSAAEQVQPRLGRLGMRTMWKRLAT